VNLSLLRSNSLKFQPLDEPELLCRRYTASNNDYLALFEYQLIEAEELRGMRAWNKTLYMWQWNKGTF
jgi:hypothetical protein